MAIEQKQPLVNQLFAIGQNIGSDGQNTFQLSGAGGGFQNRAPQAPPVQPQQGAGGMGALATVGAALGGKLMQKTPATTPDANGNGFGLGGNLVSGSLGNAAYAGQNDKNPIMNLFSSDADPYIKSGLLSQ